MGRKYRSLLMSAIASTALIVGLSACGGGGSSGGGVVSPPVSPPPSPPVSPPPPANGGIPTLFQASFEENGGFGDFEFADFTVNAPSNEEPQNLALIGADAEPFQVNFEIAAPDSNGDRIVSTTLSTSRVFNFEDPQDANGDNIYEFELTGTFQGSDLSSNFEVTIIDVDDDAETSAFSIQGETALQTFGIPLLETPDVTGDGKPEIAVTNVTGKGPASAYIIDSEFINATSSDVSVGPNTASGTRFTTTVNTGDFTPNALKSLPQADGSGADVLLSAEGNVYVFPIDDVSDYSALQGNTEPSSVADRIVYSLISPDGVVNAQLIPDVNGDNINDIAVILMNGNNGTGEAGIIFGVDGTGTPKTIANGFDVTFETLNEFTAFSRSESVQFISIPDIDGDGVNDLILAQNNFSNENVFFLRSGLLGTASATPIDLDNLDPTTQGFKLRFHNLNSITIGPDYDSDGIPTLLFFEGANDVYIIDGDEFAAIDPDTVTRLYGDTSSTLTRAGGQFSNFGAMLDDINGDGLDEFLGVSRFRGAIYLIDGQVIIDTLNNPGTINTLSQEDEFDIDLSNFIGSNLDITNPPIYLEADDLFLVPWATDSNPQVETDPGQIFIFDAGVVKDAFASGATGVTITR